MPKNRYRHLLLGLHYCIPWNYVCDGKWDCPGGYDEIINSTCNTERICLNMFKCRNSSKCIHLGDVCDNVKHCPHEDDEKFCLLNQVICPSICQCLSFAIRCTDIISNRDLEYTHLPFHVVKIVNCPKIFTFKLLEKIYLFSIFVAKHNYLDKLCFLFTDPKHLLILNVGYNKILSIPQNCFNEAPYLHTINISYNKVSHISHRGFWNLHSLKQLDLSYNALTKLFSNMIDNCNGLLFIYLQGIEIISTDKDFFKYLRLKILHTDHYKLCCLINYDTKCTSKKPWYFSCQNLLGTLCIKICFYCISIVIIVLNIISFILKMISKTTIAIIVILFINFVDFTYGIYMTIIWVADEYYSDNFLVEELKWRSSSMCFLSLSLVVNFSILSPISVLFLSIQRSIVVVFPLKTQYKEKQFVAKCLWGLFIVAISFAILITALIKHIHKVIP